MSARAAEDMRRGWCPGTLRPMETGDGLLVRLHPPGGAFTPAQLATIAALAAAHGNGVIDATGRGNLQLRGLTPASHRALVADLLAHGLVDEPEGDGPKRLTIVSPLAGRDPAETIDGAALAAAVEARARTIAGLPAKIVVAVDGGGALAPDPAAADMTVRAVGRDTVRIALPQGLTTGPIPSGIAPDIIAVVLSRFANFSRDTGGVVRRLRQLDNAQVARLLPEGIAVSDNIEPARPPLVEIGAFAERGGTAALLIGLPFGQTDQSVLAAIARLAEAAGAVLVRPTPWRGLALLGLPRDRADGLREALGRLGLVVEPTDPRLSVVACTGSPACARGLAPARKDAARLTTVLARLVPPGGVVHVSGCAKGCAHAGPAALTFVGTAGGYGLVRNGGAGDRPAAAAPLDQLALRLAQEPVPA